MKNLKKIIVKTKNSQESLFYVKLPWNFSWYKVDFYCNMLYYFISLFFQPCLDFFSFFFLLNSPKIIFLFQKDKTKIYVSYNIYILFIKLYWICYYCTFRPYEKCNTQLLIILNYFLLITLKLLLQFTNLIYLTN